METDRLNFFCRIFGHSFKVVQDKEEIPITPNDVYDMLASIKKGCNSSHVAAVLQERVELSLNKTTVRQLYCKRCGKVVNVK